MKKLIQLTGISKSYDKVLFENINITINRGELVVILGESGCGKSTLLNIIGCIEEFNDGTYYFENLKIEKGVDYSELRLKKIGFVYQNYNLLQNLTCYENIELPSIYQSEQIGKYNIHELSEWLKIADILNKKVNVISGGEKQRVSIARAILFNPLLLIADEPTGNLDVENKDMVLQIFKKYITDFEASVIIVTHDQELSKYADKVFQFEKGSLYEV